MNAVGFFIKRPLASYLVTALALLIGLFSYLEIRKEGWPTIVTSIIITVTPYPGVTADDIEIVVTEPIEKALEGVNGVTGVFSTSQNGLSVVSAELPPNFSRRQSEKTLSEINNAIAQIQGLPRDLPQSPRTKLLSSDDLPVIEIAFSGERAALGEFLPPVVSRIEGVPNVSSLLVLGKPEPRTVVAVDTARAALHRLDLLTLDTLMRRNLLQGSAGLLRNGDSEIPLHLSGPLKRREELADIKFPSALTRKPVRLGEIGTVEESWQTDGILVRNNGDPGVAIFVFKRSGADILEVTDDIAVLLEGLDLPPGIEYSLLNDQSQLTRHRLRMVGQNAVLGFFLVVAVLFAAFDIRSAFWIGIGIPFSFLVSLAVVKALGMSMNALTLIGFVIALGMIVDDAVVVGERMNALREKGLSSAESGVEAVRSVFKPVTASTLTTILAFATLLSVKGLPGKFIWIIPFIISLSLLISLVECFILLPSHLCHGSPHIVRKRTYILKLEGLYSAALGHALKLRGIILVLVTCLFAVSVYAIQVYVKKDPFPQDAAEGFTVRLKLPPGTGIEKTEKRIVGIEKELRSLPGNELKGFSVKLGTEQLVPLADHRDSGNSAVINVYLSHLSRRERTADEIMVGLRTAIAKSITDMETQVFLELTRYGPPMGKPFEIRIVSNDNKRRKEITDAIFDFVSDLDGVEEVERNDLDLIPRFEAIPEVDRLIRNEVPTADILGTLRIAFHGDALDYTTSSGERMRLVLTAEQGERETSDLLDNLYVIRGRVRKIPLSDLVTVKKTEEPGSIHRINGMRTTTISGNLDKTRIEPEMVHARVRETFSSPRGADLSFAGQPVENRRVFGDLMMAIGLAVAGIYVLISITMNSVYWPLIVIVAVPFGLIGVVLSLLAHGMPLSVFAGTALVGTIGVVVNGSILMVYKLRETQAMSTPEGNRWIIEVAVTRLRPILLTTVTTVLAIFPAATGLGGYDPFMSPMCLSLIYGLAIGSIFTLFLIPILFSLSCDIGVKKNRVGTRP